MKKIYIVFITICIILCLVPLIGMSVRPTTITTENRTAATFPNIKDRDGKVNLQYFQQFERYFNEHFAFRNELVYADARIQNDIFKVSSVDSVIAGSDGWLFYTSTLEDYLGTGQLSDRDIYNIAHNIDIAKRYIEGSGKTFVLTIPANKNTLYDDNMPYYDSYKVNEIHNLEKLTPLIEELRISYVDLLTAFRNENEILYLKRDSHWNNKGALMAYNLIMNKANKLHDDYSNVDVTRTIDEDGDLNRMLYTLYGKREPNYRYDIIDRYKYVNDVNSVEDGWIETECERADGSLLMFRDSFGNTLIPFISNQYRKCYFTKAIPYALESLVETYNPDTVIFEKVERNISEFIKMPPIVSAPVVTGIDDSKISEEINQNTTIAVKSFAFDYNYYEVNGMLDDSVIQERTNVLINIDGTYYEAYHTENNGYAVYVKKTTITELPINIKVVTENGGEYKVVQTRLIKEGELE